jgi:Ni/Co efflux regulator RcnB
MKHAFFISTTAVACLAWAGAGWAEPPGHDAGVQKQQSNKSARGGPAAPTGARSLALSQHAQVTVQSAPRDLGRASTAAAAHVPAPGWARPQSQQAQQYRVQRAPTGVARNAAAVVAPTQTSTTHGRANVAVLNRNIQASQRFSAGAYTPPVGYMARRWSYGQNLPAAYYSRGYWINDFLLYALYGPPPGYVWVRVGDDALLINRYTGRIVAVDYGVFY